MRTGCYRGNRRVLEDNADAIYRYLGFLKSIRKDDGTIEYGLGDWCQIGALRDSDPWIELKSVCLFLAR